MTTNSYNPGVALAALRRPREGVCPECGDSWTSEGSHQVYCSKRCAVRVAVRAHRARQKGKKMKDVNWIVLSVSYGPGEATLIPMPASEIDTRMSEYQNTNGVVFDGTEGECLEYIAQQG